ncbi:radical SAM/SPASM domain-containing protein [Limisalsivibrio acetivorans]|uniref:radical SAM/SPASM domain-containing protein n=1 Tax=Limisalsivibrio acetivorans TaxID=1304888 RepID=UPI0003B6881F|nr:radical SAM/SPASM domain-containing protein [Limisalsivibrio acetivorans]
MISKNRDEDRREFLRPDFPQAVGISLGEWQCNRLCRMCPMFSQRVERERYITDEVFEKACRDMAGRKISLELSAYGETFQHPKADEYLFTSRRLCPDAHIVVATNGTLIDKERAEKIVDSGIDNLSFSLDAGSAETYKWLTGAVDYENVCRNLETLVETRNKRGADHLFIQTHIIGISELEHEFKDFLERWEGVTDKVYVRGFGNWAGLVNENEVTGIDVDRYGNRIEAEVDCPGVRYPCAWLWYATKIEPNGDVSKCFIHVTGEKNPLGNIMEEDFEGIWKGEKLAEYRRLHLQNRPEELEFCERCSVWSLFPNFWHKTDNDSWE